MLLTIYYITTIKDENKINFKIIYQVYILIYLFCFYSQTPNNFKCHMGNNSDYV